MTTLRFSLNKFSLSKFSLTLLAFCLLLLGAIGGAGAQAPTAAQLGSPTLYLNSDTGLYSDLAKTTPITAGATPIAVWADQSGNGYDFTQATSANRPQTQAAPGSVANGGVLFTGSATNYLDGGNPAGLNLSSGSYTVVLVVNAPTGSYNTFLCKGPGSWTSRFWFLANPTGFDRYNLGALLPIKTPCIQTYEFAQTSGNTGTETFHANGSYVQKYSSTLTAWDSTNNYRLGITSDNQFPLTGDILCVLIYNTVLSDTQRRAIENTLGTYYHIPTQTTLDTSKNIVLTGNSLAAGTGATTYGDPGSQLSRMLGSRYNVANLSLGGTHTSEWTTKGTFVDSYYNASAAYNILTYYEIVNDIGSGALTPTQCYNGIVAYLGARKAKGYKVIMHTCIQNGFDTDANRNAVNALFRADFTAVTPYARVFGPASGVTYADALVDIAADPAFWSLTNANPNYSSLTVDGIHLKDAGYALMAAYDLCATYQITGTGATITLPSIKPGGQLRRSR